MRQIVTTQEGGEKFHDDLNEYYFYVQVYGNGTVFIDSIPDSLRGINAIPGQPCAGFAITAADGRVPFYRWRGPAYWRASTPLTYVNVTFPGADLSDHTGTGSKGG